MTDTAPSSPSPTTETPKKKKAPKAKLAVVPPPKAPKVQRNISGVKTINGQVQIGCKLWQYSLTPKEFFIEIDEEHQLVCVVEKTTGNGALIPFANVASISFVK